MKSSQIVNYEGSIYWRSDTRNPIEKEKIFENGFQPREPVNGKKWWRETIQVNENGGIDAVKTRCICLSTNFFSAALFPILNKKFQKNTNETYVYAIALPQSNKINLDINLDFSKSYDTPLNDQNAIIDLHSLQTEKTRLAIEENIQQYNANLYSVLEAGWTLYGYEAIAQHVNSTNIIAAVKITRGPQKMHMKKNEKNEKNEGLPSFDFEISSEVLINKNFILNEKLPILDKNNQFVMANINYSEIRNNMLTLFNSRSLKGKLTTPTPLYGLGGKTFKSPDKELSIVIRPPILTEYEELDDNHNTPKK